MKRFKNSRLFSRTSALALSLLIVVAGVAFAALQSQPNTLTGNTIETATANLQLSMDGYSYTTTSHAGFDFNGLIPGGPAQPVTGNSFYLKNTGTTPLTLKLAVSSVPTNPSNVDLSKVNVLVTTVGGSGAQSFSLQSLITAAATGGLSLTSSSLANGAYQQYKLQVSMASDAMTGTNASIGNIDLAFSGISS